MFSIFFINLMKSLHMYSQWLIFHVKDYRSPLPNFIFDCHFSTQMAWYHLNENSCINSIFKRPYMLCFKFLKFIPVRKFNMVEWGIFPHVLLWKIYFWFKKIRVHSDMLIPYWLIVSFGYNDCENRLGSLLARVKPENCLWNP